MSQIYQLFIVNEMPEVSRTFPFDPTVLVQHTSKIHIKARRGRKKLINVIILIKNVPEDPYTEF